MRAPGFLVGEATGTLSPSQCPTTDETRTNWVQERREVSLIVGARPFARRTAPVRCSLAGARSLFSPSRIGRGPVPCLPRQNRGPRRTGTQERCCIALPAQDLNAPGRRQRKRNSREVRAPARSLRPGALVEPLGNAWAAHRVHAPRARKRKQDLESGPATEAADPREPVTLSQRQLHSRSAAV